MKESLEKIKKKITDHDIEGALVLLKSLALAPALRQELNVIESRKNKLLHDKRKGTITYEQENIQTNGIIDAILLLVLEVEKKSTEPKLKENKSPLIPLKAIYFGSIALIFFIFIIYLVRIKASYSSIPNDKALVIGVENSILFTGEDYEKSLKLHFKSRNSPEFLLVEIDNRQLTTLEFYLKVYNQKEKNYAYLSIELDSAACTFLEETNCLKDGYYQICEHDFDNDKDPEILIAYQDGFDNLSVYIFKYFPPQSNSYVDREENLDFIGKLSGQRNIILEKDRIKIPFGGQGLIDEYVYIDDQIISNEPSQ